MLSCVGAVSRRSLSGQHQSHHVDHWHDVWRSGGPRRRWSSCESHYKSRQPWPFPAHPRRHVWWPAYRATGQWRHQSRDSVTLLRRLPFYDESFFSLFCPARRPPVITDNFCFSALMQCICLLWEKPRIRRKIQAVNDLAWSLSAESDLKESDVESWKGSAQNVSLKLNVYILVYFCHFSAKLSSCKLNINHVTIF